MMLLTLLPAVPVWKSSSNFVFDRKFYDGILKYCEHWPGTVRCVMRISTATPPKFGLVTVAQNKTPFELQLVNAFREISDLQLNDSTVILASGDDHELLHISQLVRNKDAKIVYIIECNLRTQIQIVRLNAPSQLSTLKRSIFTLWHEIRRKRAFSIADGIQANGTPAYESYASSHREDLLYFDSRINPDLIITETQLETRLKYLDRGRPIRLAFSGRLIKIKGVEDLLEVAEKLDHMNIDFTLSIFGEGDQKNKLQDRIIEKQLTEKVFIKGAVDFESSLLNTLRKEVDLFICLHKQGDPSCTYIETLSCGVPIVGYDNEAFSGILSTMDVGWSTPINNTVQTAHVISHLSNNRNLIREKSIESIKLSRLHDFKSTAAKRINHLIEISTMNI